MTQLTDLFIESETGGLFRMISKLMIAQSQSSTKPADLDRFMTLFGRLFQIRDDFSNLTSDQVHYRLLYNRANVD